MNQSLLAFDVYSEWVVFNGLQLILKDELFNSPTSCTDIIFTFYLKNNSKINKIAQSSNGKSFPL